jgi:hypothetical protein
MLRLSGQLGVERHPSFRWESFNLLNRTQFNAINSGFGPSKFLHVTNTHHERRMQLGLRFYF